MSKHPFFEKKNFAFIFGFEIISNQLQNGDWRLVLSKQE